MADGRKQKGRDNAKRNVGRVLGFDKRFKDRTDSVKNEAIRIGVSKQDNIDWGYLRHFGYSASVIFSKGIKHCMNEIAIKRVDESLYGEFEAFVMYKKRNGKHGLVLEPRAIRSKLDPRSITYDHIAIIGLSPCPRGDNMIVIRYYKLENGRIVRKEIHSIRKKVDFIDEEILLFFANGGTHAK